MSTFGNNGRLGNQLFQRASLIGLSRKHNKELRLPKWHYAQFFDSEFPELSEEIQNAREVLEPTFHYVPEWPYIEENENVDIKGYLQSEKYFQDNREEILKTFTFKEDFRRQVKAQFSGKNVFGKETIAISIRRGDYVDNPNYELLPITYYILALFENFPNWRNCNIIVFSDDIPYCKVHFDCLENVRYSVNNSDIEDICLMSQCDNFIISNSTFSWWGAYLGEKPGGKVVRPNYLFKGKLLQKNDFKDFYPDRFLPFEHKEENGEYKKIDLRDCCFMLPVFYDHSDRKENLDLCIEILKRNFHTDIYVFEQGEENKFDYVKVDLYYFNSYNGVFHRTKMLNDMAANTDKAILFNWDVDVFIAPLQIYETAYKIRKGADMVYPYEWAFARFPRSWYEKLKHYQDIGIVGDTKFNGMNTSDAISVGGAVAYSRKSYIQAGGENEKFISFGPEDVERMLRFDKLGFKLERTYGTLYHLQHFVGDNSNSKHKHFHSNNKELDVIRSLTKNELEYDVQNWELPTRLKLSPPPTFQPGDKVVTEFGMAEFFGMEDETYIFNVIPNGDWPDGIEYGCSKNEHGNSIPPRFIL